jgi:hypothetical protein
VTFQRDPTNILFTGPSSKQMSMQNKFFTGVAPEYSNLFTTIKDNLTKHTVESQSVSLGNIWKSRSDFRNGNLYVEPTSPEDWQNTLLSYSRAAIEEIQSIDLALIVASWLFYAHERIANQIVPTFNKGVILTSSSESNQSFNKLNQVYWALRSGVFQYQLQMT